MKTSVLITLLILSLSGHSQELFTDNRDGKTYRTLDVNGTLWMIDNLDYVSELSLDFDQKESNYNLKGRYYDLRELDQVLPEGWRLPTVADWVALFQFIADQQEGVELNVSSIAKPVHYTIANYSEKINLFQEGNEVNLQPTGRVEGGRWNIPNNYADYWTNDDQEEAEGRTHIHIMNPWTTIHSHMHHLKVGQKKKLRLFMIRGVMRAE